MDHPTSHSSTFGPLTRVAFERICRKFCFRPDGWAGPELTVDGTDYKLDWHKGDTEQITLYADGVVQYYKNDGVEGEDTITSLHDHEWVKTLTARQMEPLIAISAVDFFRQLKGLEV